MTGKQLWDVVLDALLRICSGYCFLGVCFAHDLLVFLPSLWIVRHCKGGRQIDNGPRVTHGVFLLVITQLIKYGNLEEPEICVAFLIFLV